MNILGLQRATIAAAATAFALALTIPGVGQTQTHAHDATSPPSLSLDHGRKWATDAPLRTGMSRIRTLVAPRLATAHAGKLSPAQYVALAGQIEGEVGGIVADCKLEPQADAVLHIVIGEIVAGTTAMSGKSAEHRPQQGLLQVANAVNDYASHFDHPGFTPIPVIH